MDETETHFTHEDRRVLTEVNVKLNRAIEDISDLTKNFATKEEVNVLDKRLTAIEPVVGKLNMKIWIAMGAIIVITGTVIPMGIYIFNTRTQTIITPEIISKSVVEAINQYNLSLDNK